MSEWLRKRQDVVAIDQLVDGFAAPAGFWHGNKAQPDLDCASLDVFQMSPSSHSQRHTIGERQWNHLTHKTDDATVNSGFEHIRPLLCVNTSVKDMFKPCLEFESSGGLQ